MFGPAAFRRVIRRSSGLTDAQIARIDIANAAAISPLRGRIVVIAESQVGYRTDPANTYCNKFSAYWYSGANTCGNGNLSEEWCADFAAWVWQKAGAEVTYAYVNGDLNSSSASFYECGASREVDVASRWLGLCPSTLERTMWLLTMGSTLPTLFRATRCFMRD